MQLKIIISREHATTGCLLTIMYFEKRESRALFDFSAPFIEGNNYYQPQRKYKHTAAAVQCKLHQLLQLNSYIEQSQYAATEQELCQYILIK